MLTTHVLDTSQGRPAAGMRFEVFRDGEAVASGETDGNGRAKILERAEPGVYEIQWAVGAYFGLASFLDVVPVRFRVTDEGHYHVPLLVSPWSYTTYRGS
jgi:5-hydroxyisourate hydrolase